MRKIIWLSLWVVLIVLSACQPMNPPPVENPAVSSPSATPVEQELLASPEAVERVESTPTPQPAEAKHQPIVLTDALGRTVTLPDLPRRIVVAGRGVALLADAVYLFPESFERVVAVSRTSQSPDGDFLALVDQRLPEKIAFETNVGAEQVVTARPDVVLLKPYMQEPLGNPLEALGIPVVYLSMETPQEYQRDLQTLGILFGNSQRADEVWAFYQQHLDAVSNALKDLTDEQKPRVLLLYYSDRDGQVAFNVAPKTWLQTILTGLAGGIPVWTDIELGSGWTKVNLEQIASWDADRIFIIAYTANPQQVVENLLQDPQWQSLRAVQEGHLYAFPRDYYSWDQPDPRWILGLRYLAYRLHPEAFPNFDLMTEARLFFERFYGLDARTFEEKILPVFKGDFR
ncbi:MAG: ABC transporter substrate-binding protein [Chloroflexota bacterium]